MRVELVEYDPAWPRVFDAEAQRIREALGDVLLRVDHVGSTAVPGLAAKPVIDIQVSVRSFVPFEAYADPLLALGYVHGTDPAEPEHRFFGLGDGSARRFHIHVCESATAWERRHLGFRDGLRNDPDLRTRYEAEKRRIAAVYPDDSLAYAEAKTPWIRAEERRLGLIR
ncbi:MAG TPA: GrpB family protein [Actinomycetota bacterium]